MDEGWELTAHSEEACELYKGVSRSVIFSRKRGRGTGSGVEDRSCSGGGKIQYPGGEGRSRGTAESASEEEEMRRLDMIRFLVRQYREVAMEVIWLSDVRRSWEGLKNMHEGLASCSVSIG